MKILQISTELVHSGAERIVYDLSCFLQENGHQVQVACVKDTRGEVGDWLENKNIPVYWVDLSYKKPIKAIVNLVKFIRFVRREHFDLVHAHQFHANVIGRLARFFGGSKVVSTVHLVERRWRPWHFIFDSLTAFLCVKEICVSRAVLEFTAQKVPFIKKKLLVIYNGVQFERESVNLTKVSLPESISDKFIFGAVGRLTQQKGFIYLLEAFLSLQQKQHEMGLIIIGEGPERVRLQKFIEENELGKSVVLLGYQKFPDLFYQEMDVFVMPSLFEGFGLVAVEAMHFGLPVIATQVDSLPEIIYDGVTGYLCPSKDASALAEVMEKVFLNHDSSKNIALAGQKFVHENFPVSKMFQEHLKLYAAVACNK